jgi:hypothetical protein
LVLEHDLKPRERVRNGACQSFKDRRKHAWVNKKSRKLSQLFPFSLGSSYRIGTTWSKVLDRLRKRVMRVWMEIADDLITDEVTSVSSRDISVLALFSLSNSAVYILIDKFSFSQRPHFSSILQTVLWIVFFLNFLG